MQKRTLYPAKINRPIFRRVLVRERLFSMLDSLGPEPLVWVSGPAGSGKTTFLSSYIDTRRVPCIWYQVDESDVDPATFFHYLQLAHQKKTGKKGSLPKFTPVQCDSLTSFTHRYFERFFSGLPDGLFIIFDNFQYDLTGSVLDIILHGLSRLPSDLRIAIISRSEMPPAVSSLKIKDRMRAITAEEMKLDSDEFFQAARLHGVKGIPLGLMETMHRKLEGWTAGLLLMAEALKITHLEPPLLLTARNDLEKAHDDVVFEIFDFFTGEIWEKTDDDVRDFLVQTSFLPQMTVKAARELTDYKHAARTLEYLSNRNIFTSRTRQQPVIYKYHGLFRQYLQNYAENTLSPEQLDRIRLRTAGILQAEGYHEQAALLLIEVGAWETLSEIVIKQAPEMLIRGRNLLLSNWIKALPDRIRTGDRNIAYLEGLCLLPFEPERSRLLFLRAVEQAEKSGDAQTAYLAWARAVESVVYEANDYSKMDLLIEKKKKLDEEFLPYPSPEVEAEVATGTITALLLRGTDHQDFESLAEKAIILQKKTGHYERHILACVIAALKYYYAGDIFKMAHINRTFLESGVDSKFSPALESIMLYVQALEAWASGNPERSLELVSRGLTASENTNVHIWDKLLLGQGVLAALNSSNPGLADQYLAEMSQNMSKASKNDQSLYYYCQGYRYFQAGDHKMALSHAEKAYELKKQVGNRTLIARTALALAEIYCTLGRKKPARKYLSEAKEIAGETESKLLAFLTYLMEANISLISDMKEKAARQLKRALDTGSENNIMLFWWFDRDTLANLLILALERGIQTDYVQNLIMAHKLMTMNRIPDLESWPWPVRIYTLGRFEILVNGDKIGFQGKAQDKPVNLLKAILAFGGRKVPADRLVEVLWPDSEGPAAQQALATTLHRLRRLINVQDAVLFTQGQVSLNPKLCWVDVWVVERALGQNSRHLDGIQQTQDKVAEAAHLIEKSLELYKGHFLGTDGHDHWTIGPRERLRSKYLRTLRSYCVYLESRGEDERAILWYRKALELDPLAEEIYQGLMLSCIKLGRKAEGVDTYNRCRQTLSLMLGVDPSPATEALGKRIAGETSNSEESRGDEERGKR